MSAHDISRQRKLCSRTQKTRGTRRNRSILSASVAVLWFAELPSPALAFTVPRPLISKLESQTLLFSTTEDKSLDELHSRQSDSGEDISDNDSNPWRRSDLFGSSLIDETLQNLETDGEFQSTAARYATQGAAKISSEERANRRRALDSLGIPSFNAFLKQQNVRIERKPDPTLLQLNIGLYCNQACGHCHVESSPLRTEMMSTETAARCLKLLAATPSIKTLDITGGAPELNANFRYIVSMARELCGPDLEIIDRCNLTVLQEPGQEDLIEFLKMNRVRIVCSLPCYSRENVDKQRGRGVFERSIAALLALNEAGYGKPGTGLGLDLVYNPGGAFLPPPQASLEATYKEELRENFGILFNSLFTLANMPIKRFADYFHRNGELKDYMELLVNNFNKNTTKGLMCTDLVSVGYDGTIYDCDFNQQLGYAVGGKPAHHGGLTVFEIDTLSLKDYKIRLDNHCFGCTAGMGSSCQGTTT
ncbi:hypothetical protein MPSEU_000703100 [Mayamaea pseudoterrestris]|nr:hypothetical protein MPSEU_000703100 [Mayamaea pseudoterrestris]